MIRQRGWCWLAFPLLVLSNVGWAEDDTQPIALDEDGPQPIVLDTVTVLGTRTERPTDKIPRTVDVIGSEQITRQQSGNLGSVLDILPNVSVTGSPRPMGETIQIRGLSGQRVLMLLDGARQVFGRGHLSRGFIEPDMIKRIDVQRGPASVLWGSGAIGGVVSVETKDAKDLLAPGKLFGARFRGSYQSAVDGWFGSGALYGRPTDYLDMLVYASRRENDNLELGNGTTLPFSNYRRSTVLAKATFYPTANQSIGISHRQLWLNGHAPANPTATLSSSNFPLDRNVTLRSSHINWRLTPESPLVDLRTQLYHTKRSIDAYAASLNRRDYTTVDTLGWSLTNTTRHDFGFAGAHALTYGSNGYQNSAEGTRNGAPRPMFPNAFQRVFGLFAQDEVSWDLGWWGKWITTLGVRWDHWHSESNKHVASDQDKHQLNWQAGVLWQTTDWLSLYFSYAEAFRAPTLTELYAIGKHFGFNRFVPNPNLKPEQAANKELGLRTSWSDLLTAGDRLKMGFAVFRNDVDNFIGLEVNVVPLKHPPFVGGTTRSQNVAEARLEGIEANLAYTTDAWFATLAYGQTRGQNMTKNQPLQAIAPPQFTGRFGLTDLPWNGQILFRATVVQNQNRVPPSGQDQAFLQTPGYTVYDVLTSWYPIPRLRVDFAITNLTNKAYRRHTAVIDAVGRSFKASITWKF